jgi:hypothetical protein
VLGVMWNKMVFCSSVELFVKEELKLEQQEIDSKFS